MLHVPNSGKNSEGYLIFSHIPLKRSSSRAVNILTICLLQNSTDQYDLLTMHHYKEGRWNSNAISLYPLKC